jgi:hypothetical protein
MLGSVKSSCLEMICADFLAGANLDDGIRNLLRSVTSFLVSTLRTATQIPGARKPHSVINSFDQNTGPCVSILPAALQKDS